ncbi:hypothetical protein GGP41_008562 [Bipolaris sorokiniana]|uniref:Uncharacterized protein n=1 Tax=Cochliobolus sativus TaxID=45130 RepID=A0A8H5ZD62_COCSA|nr:hypothetical protein GGP41_008562 [Bipolaris sorokiniana]
MNVQLVSNWAHAVQTFAVASLFVALVALILNIERRLKLWKIPKFVAFTNGFKDSIYRVAVNGEPECILLPTKLLPELKKHPDDVLNVMEAGNKLFELEYTKYKTLDLNMIHCIKASLTPALGD